MTLIFNKLKLRQILRVSHVRYGHGKDHWSKLKKKKTAKDKALAHFDDFYANVYGDSWADIRAALLDQKCKYMAIVNNFSDTERVQHALESIGAINLKSIYDSQKGNLKDIEARKLARKQKLKVEQDFEDPELIQNHLSEIQKMYPADYPNLLDSRKVDNTESKNKYKPIPVKLQSIDESLSEVNLDLSRIVDPSVNSTGLHEYIPATKIKGLDDWILESDHYKFYAKASDFQIKIEEESILPFPKHLRAYTFERGNKSRFPQPTKGSTGVLDYYLFDGASILPVLALDIQLGDIVLDMCAAPGGKALTILQTLMPRILIANDATQSRVRKLKNVMDQFFTNVYTTENMLRITERDARAFDEVDTYNKILVDVPCTTDRHILHTDDNNVFKPSRIKERLRMPEVQSDILTHALKLVKVGGTVVYATCSLSPIQNDGVVQVALKGALEESNCAFVVKDMTEALAPLQYIYEFGNIELRYGHIVIPTCQNNWGPMYFCKIVKIQ